MNNIEYITKEHILKAIEKINKEGVPPRRNFRKYYLKHNGKMYPPKLVLSYAYYFAFGKELPYKEFKGGKMTNIPLINLGFTIIEK